jgi:hypothetical protein
VDFFKWAAEQVASGEIALTDIQQRYAFPQLPPQPWLTVLRFAGCRFYLYNPLRQNPCRPPIPSSSNIRPRP